MAAPSARAAGYDAGGWVYARHCCTSGDIVAAVKQGLHETGYVDGVNVTVEYRSAESRYDRLPAIAADFVQHQVAVIVAGTPVAALAAKQATASIPIVFAVGSDPVRDGLVASLSRPGGNITGATFFSNLLTGKRLGLLHELVPNARAFGGLVNPKNANAQFQINEAEQAARSLGLPISFVNASSETDIDKAFNQLRRERADALLVLSDSFLNTQARRIAEGALQHTLPFQPASHIENRPWRVVSWVMARAELMPRGNPAFMLAVSSRGRKQPICRFSSLPNSSSS